MRIAHIIMAHKNPAQVERLIRKMSFPGFDLYIHLDKKTDIRDFLYLETFNQVRFIRNRTVCNWGGNSFFRATINSVSEVLNSGIKYDFINLISGQDYPIKPIEDIYNFFSRNISMSFISYEGVEGSEWWKTAKDRYEKYHFTDMNFRGKYLLQRIINSIVPPRKFPLTLELYGGSNASWWTISTDCAAYIIATLKANPKLEKFLNFCWCTDEFVIPTLIMNSPLRNKVVNVNYRYIDWSAGKAHPKILVQDDFNKLIATDMLFARKFDTEVDAEILEKIDAYTR